MNKILTTALALSWFPLILLVSAASGQQRTFVSGLGNDGNPCSRSAPCRTFTQALSATSAGGEVIVLDSAGFGPFAISQPVSIIAPPGVYAGIAVFTGNGIDINVGSSDKVILRGLTVNNQGSSGSGISFNSGGTLHVESCVANGFSSSGITSGLLFAGGGTLEVKESAFSGNGTGIYVNPSTGTAAAVIDAVLLEDNQAGLAVSPPAHVTIRNSVATNHGASGIAATSIGSPMDAEINVENCLLANNVAGISANSNSAGVARVRVSNSTVTDNGKGLWNLGGAAASILSRGNNTVEGNGADLVGTIGSYTAK